MHFDAIGRVPGDPILGLMEACMRRTPTRTSSTSAWASTKTPRA